ncbi:hypothetical protein DFJ43DRAFT_1158444 [Lentinula guzmanii]|uniref:Uncharacterized protein n=1 Tax=Lentinula guzmanii TaxID=2804957 RepID=A0AA38JAE7_9AGAR|nr:hypothetical protein DFJ43DRAFT_1158444 [Lentinula guzmanii]
MPALHCPISINRPTPEERSISTQAARESTWGMKHPPKLPPPLPGWIRVKFYSHIYKIRHEMLPDMEGDVQLSRSGWLDLRVVCRIWNLEACTPIDPMRWVPVEPTRSFWLSPIAVHVLSAQNQCIMIIEPTPLSPTTAHKRELRDASFHLYTSFFMLFHLMYSVPITIAHTSVAFVRRWWIWCGRRSRIPMWIENAIIPLIMLLSWFARKKEDFDRHAIGRGSMDAEAQALDRACALSFDVDAGRVFAIGYDWRGSIQGDVGSTTLLDLGTWSSD